MNLSAFYWSLPLKKNICVFQMIKEPENDYKRLRPASDAYFDFRVGWTDIGATNLSPFMPGSWNKNKWKWKYGMKSEIFLSRGKKKRKHTHPKCYITPWNMNYGKFGMQLCQIDLTMFNTIWDMEFIEVDNVQQTVGVSVTFYLSWDLI